MSVPAVSFQAPLCTWPNPMHGAIDSCISGNVTGVTNGSTTVVVPPALAPGSYFLIARADADDILAEAKETNNTRTRAFQVSP